MVQISTPWGDPQPGNGPPVTRFLSNYFDLLFVILFFFSVTRQGRTVALILTLNGSNVSAQGSAFWGSGRWVTSYGENISQKLPQKGRE